MAIFFVMIIAMVLAAAGGTLAVAVSATGNRACRFRLVILMEIRASQPAELCMFESHSCSHLCARV